MFAHLNKQIVKLSLSATGRVLHSHSYRYPTPFSKQSVVVLGANASGLDISIELAKSGAQVQKEKRNL